MSEVFPMPPAPKPQVFRDTELFRAQPVPENFPWRLDQIQNPQISAVVLSRVPIERPIPGIITVNHVSKFRNARELLVQRLESIKKVRTKWFFFLDDDDMLPLDYCNVLDECMAADVAVAYTHEEVRWVHDQPGHVRRSFPYSEDLFVRYPMLIHHLAVCNTEAALRAIPKLPMGTFCVENLLYFVMAKESVKFIDKVGYVWMRHMTGLARHPTLLTGQIKSALWAKRNKS